MYPIMLITLKAAWRDRLFHLLLALALLLILLIPVFSLFSMRQVQELSITLSLSAISLLLLILSTLLGTSAIWRDIERHYTTATLGLPLSRTSYVLGKFFANAIIILSCTLLLAAIALPITAFSASRYPSGVPVQWTTLAIAIGMDGLKYILLSAVALLFSSFSTSFFLPFFGTISIYLAGNASQEVYEYISGEFGKTLSAPVLALLKGVYYLLPNFLAFNLKVQAVYGLPLNSGGLMYTFLYFFIYTALLLFGSVWLFSRRELN